MSVLVFAGGAFVGLYLLIVLVSSLLIFCFTRDAEVEMPGGETLLLPSRKEARDYASLLSRGTEQAPSWRKALD